MDTLMGLLILVAVVWIVRTLASSGRSTDSVSDGRTRAAPTSGTRAADRDPLHTPDSSSGRTAPPPPRTTRDPERRRQNQADAAFIDGVLFAHYFDPFDRFGDNGEGEDPQDEAVWGDEAYDDDWNDAFHDDLGDW